MSQFYGGIMPQTNQFPGMVRYNGVPLPKMTNPLKDIDERIRSGSAKAIQITQEAIDRAVCTHRTNYQLMLESTHNPNEPDEKVCAICGAVFNLIEGATPEQIHRVVKDCIDTLHTLKVMYVDIPDKLDTEIFQIIAMLEQIDKLWGIATERFQKYENPYGYGNQVNQYGNTFGLFNQIAGGQNPFVGGMYGGYPYATQPMNGMGAPMVTPAMDPNAQMMAGGQMAQGVPNMPNNMNQQPYVDPTQQQSIWPQNYGGMMMPNQQAMAMTANAPGMSNGFGVTAPAATVNQPAVQQPAQTAEQQPAKVTRKLEA